MRLMIAIPWTDADRGAQPHTVGVSHHQPITASALGLASSVLKGRHLKLFFLFLQLHPRSIE